MADTPVDQTTTSTAVPKDVQTRMSRGRERMRKKAARRRMFYKFWRGETYWYVNNRGLLVSQDTVSWTAGGKMPDHRIRNRYPFIAAIVQAKVSAATQRVPGYEIVPSTTEPEDAQAADLATKVAQFGYDEWRLRRAAVKTVEHAFVGGEGFAYPQFDNSLGPFAEDPVNPGESVGQGDVRVPVFSGNEVYWEGGVDFDDSRWYVVEQARPLDVVKDMPGFLETRDELKADATDAESPVEDRPSELVLVKEYLERPSVKRPQGRRLIVANGRLIVPPEPYPCMDHKGNILDEPVLLRLSYIAETDDRDRGLVEQLVDLQRTIQDAWSKLLEWKNRCVAAETLVATRDGLRSASELAGTEADTLCGDGQFRKAKWQAMGTDRLWKVTFDNGDSTYATKDHRWITRDHGRDYEVTTPMLEGRAIPLRSAAPHQPIEDVEDWWHGVRHGLMWGDGQVEHHRKEGREYAYGVVRQYGSDENLSLVERFFPDTCGERREYENRPWVSARGIDPSLKSVPAFDRGFDYLRGFLAGAVASDGSVSRHTVTISQSNREELEAVATLARSVGIRVNSLTHTAKGSWSLRFAKHSFVDKDGVDTNLILKPSHQSNLGQPTKYRREGLCRVVSVEPTERVEETYCCTELVTGTWVLGNGLLTGNCLNPQMTAPRGSNMARRDDTPGATWFYTPVGGQKPEWERPPQVPQELFQMLDKAVEHMRAIAADIDVQAEPDLAAQTAQAAIEESRQRWQSFLGDLAEWHSRVMRRCLYLVQRNYTEPRLIKIQGLFGPDLTPGFLGDDLLGQADIRVSPDSLATLSKQAVIQRAQMYFQNGWIDGHQAMAAIEGGIGEVLAQSWKYDMGRANHIIQTIRRGPQELFKMRPNPDGSPGWMPREFDKVEIQMDVFETWMKTAEWDRLDDGMREAAMLVYQGLQKIQQQRQVEQAVQQTQMAQGLGMANAAQPQAPKPMPSQPNPANQAGPNGQQQG